MKNNTEHKNQENANQHPSEDRCCIDTIRSLFLELGITDQYADILKAYFTARIIASYTPNGQFANVMAGSGELRKTLYNFKDAISPAYSEEHYPIWVGLCEVFRSTGLEQDYMRFLSEFTPYIVQDWSRFLFHFRRNNKLATGNMLMTLCLILDHAPTEVESISREEIRHQYIIHESLFQKLGLNLDAYWNCWNSVHCTALVDTTFSPPTSITRAIECYRQQMLPMTDLLEDYARLHLQEGLIQEKFAVRGNRRKKDHTRDTEGGRSSQDRALEFALHGLAKERPTDVIQALFYSHQRNDASFECVFLFQAFRDMTQIHHRILVVNPSPDFLLWWENHPIECEEICFAVLDRTLSMLYTSEFPKYRFVAIEDLNAHAPHYDRLLLIARDMPVETMDIPVSLGAPGAEILAMVPEVSVTAANAPFLSCLRRSNFSIRSIISIPNHITQSVPKKKILLHAGNDLQQNSFLLLSSEGNLNAQMYLIHKECLRIPNSYLDGSMTLTDIRKAVTQLHIAPKKHLDAARIYWFSPEIQLRYTIQNNRNNRCAGRVYYSAKLRDEQKHRKFGDRLTPIIEKGLRRKTEQEVIAALEFAALDERIIIPVADDILDYYTGSLHTLSLKTVWYCLRLRLISRYNYRDDTAKWLFCGSNQALSLLCVSSTPEEYENALHSIFPEYKDIPKKYWELLNLILSVAVEAGILRFNPLAAYMFEISNRASRRQQSARNTLTKKILEDDEEDKIMRYLLSPSAIMYNGDSIPVVFSDGLWILGPIVMFALPQLREALALRWKDFVPTDPILGTWQFLVTKYLDDDGNPKPFANRSGNRYRRVPADPLLSRILLEYKSFLLAQYHMTEDQIGDCPIVLENQQQLQHIRSVSFCSLKAGSARCRTLISLAEIPSNQVILPDAVAGDRLVDLNQYQGNLFHTNLKYHLRHSCQLTEGELCYFLGLKAPDTFSAHYCAYDHPLLQHQMTQKLGRWSAGYLLHVSRDATPTERTETICGNSKYSFHGVSKQLVSISATLSPINQADLSGALLRISSKHGMTGTITCLGKELEDEERTHMVG